MRAFVFLLVLANLVFFAWTQGYLGPSERPDAARLSQQFAADRLHILSRDQAPPLSAASAANAAKPRPVAPAVEPAAALSAAAATTNASPAPLAESPTSPSLPERCVAWTGLSVADADAVEAALADERFSAIRRGRRAGPEGGSWWVFIPPLSNKAEAEKKAGEVRRLGITQYFIVQDPGPSRWAVSLGVFSSEKAAETHLAALRTKGVRSARVDVRPGAKGATLTVETSGESALLDTAAEVIRAARPGIRSTDCVLH